MRLLERARRAIARRRVERVLRALNARGLMLYAVCEYGRYTRVCVDALPGPMAISPRTAEAHLKAIEDREFERALWR